MAQAPPSAATHAAATIIYFDTIDSTSAEAKRRIAAGLNADLGDELRDECWIVAARQTAGYGRRGSAWRQASGDVAASLIFAAPQPAADAGQLSYAAALAVVDAVRQFAPDADLSVKWPNDILLGGAKLSGMILELIKGPGGDPMLIFGVGVNIVSKPDDVAYPTARLMDADGAPAPTPQDFVKALDSAFRRWRGAWARDGFAALRAPWTALAAGLGQTIVARLPTREARGVFKGLSETGALLIENEAGVETVTAGEVFFPDEAAAARASQREKLDRDPARVQLGGENPCGDKD
ncbi:MAG: biotin--[acetyl-CoA-carboxylase] ligase [Pseudomonadota bacterium]